MASWLVSLNSFTKIAPLILWSMVDGTLLDTHSVSQEAATTTTHTYKKKKKEGQKRKRNATGSMDKMEGQ
jgi:hypothetical protein